MYVVIKKVKILLMTSIYVKIKNISINVYTSYYYVFECLSKKESDCVHSIMEG